MRRGKTRSPRALLRGEAGGGARKEAAASKRPRLLRSRKAQTDYLWEQIALGLLAEWQGEGMPPGLIQPERSLPWWTRYPRPHSALAELGRLGNRDLIIAVACLIDIAEPAGTKKAATAIRAFRLQLRSQQARSAGCFAGYYGPSRAVPALSGPLPPRR